MIREFRDFIAKGNVMDMAASIITCAAIAASLADDIIQPAPGPTIGGI